MATPTGGRRNRVPPDRRRPPKPRRGDGLQEDHRRNSERPPGAYRDPVGLSAPPRQKARASMSVEDRIMARAFGVSEEDALTAAREIIENRRRRGKHRSRQTARKSSGRPTPLRRPERQRKNKPGRPRRDHQGRGHNKQQPRAPPRPGRRRGQGQPASEAWSATRDQVEELVADQLAAAGGARRGNPRAAPPVQQPPRVVVNMQLVPPTPSPSTSWAAWARSLFGTGQPSQPHDMVRVDRQHAYMHIPWDGTYVPGLPFPGGGWPPDGGNPFRE